MEYIQIKARQAGVGGAWHTMRGNNTNTHYRKGLLWLGLKGVIVARARLAHP